MTRFFRQIQHLLQDAQAWRTTHGNKLLRRYLEGLAENTEDAVDFIDDVSDDIWPQTTRELEEWETQFALWGSGTEQERRDVLEAAWAATGGQSPGYLQDIVQAAGFNVYAHDWWFDYDISTSTFDDSESIATETAAPTGCTFSLHGTQAFIIDNANQTVDQYALGTAFDLSTLSYVKSKALEDADPWGIYFRTDGERMYVTGLDSGYIRRYDLSTPYDVATAVYWNARNVTVEDTGPRGVTFVPNGLRMLMSGSQNDNIYQWDLTVAWDVTTATMVHSEDVLADGLPGPAELTFIDNGNKILVLDIGGNDVTQYSLPNAWDITGMTLDSAKLLTTQDTAMYGLYVDYFDNYMFTAGATNSSIYKYDIVQPGTVDPNTYTNKPLFGTTQCDDDDAECGEVPPDQTTDDSAVCNRFLALEVWYLWNDDLTQNAPPPVPDDSAAWPYFIYWGAETFPTKADVPAARRDEFERLLLKLCPTHQWIVLLVNYV